LYSHFVELHIAANTINIRFDLGCQFVHLNTKNTSLVLDKSGNPGFDIVGYFADADFCVLSTLIHFCCNLPNSAADISR
jgi:hypothetical protein